MNDPTIEYVGHVGEGGSGTYTVILADRGNHYGQIVLGKVWNERGFDQGWKWATGHGGATGRGCRTRAIAAKSLWEAWADLLNWSRRKAKP